jgi:hypothetical protein
LKDWKTKPTRFERYQARRSGLRLETSSPSKRILPFVGVSMKPKICIKVDLPEPDGPRMAMYSPRSKLRSTPSKACTVSSPMT